MNKEKYPVSVAVAKMERDKKTRKDFSGISKNSENRRNPFVVLSPLSIHSKSVVINSDDDDEEDEEDDDEDEDATTTQPKAGGKNSSNTTSSTNNMNTTVKQEEES